MIEFKNVSASYDGELAVLNDVSFTVNNGDFVAFVGTNGAGKSTTMRLVNGLLKPTSGEVLIDGVPTTSLKTSELARRIGFLFQNPDRQICCNTVREELMFGFKALGEEGSEAEARVDAMIERFGFDADAEPYLLNRGTRQLLALASIIVLAPPTIILDEPTTGLDFRECVKVMDVVRELNENGTTVIMVCHDMEVVGDFAPPRHRHDRWTGGGRRPHLRGAARRARAEGGAHPAASGDRGVAHSRARGGLSRGCGRGEHRGPNGDGGGPGMR